MTLALPYLELPDLVLLEPGKLGEGIPALSLKPFGVLVAAGVYLGALSAARYGARRGLQARALSWFIVHVVGCGFLFGHVLDVLLYAPERLAQDPWALFRVWDGLSSFGGFFGGAAGALWFGFRYRVGVLPYADVVASGLPLGWLFGRAGCALVHDHPGIASEAWFAVAYPGGGRLDLGLIELSLTLPIAIAFLLMQRRAWLLERDLRRTLARDAHGQPAIVALPDVRALLEAQLVDVEVECLVLVQHVDGCDVEPGDHVHASLMGPGVSR